MVVNDDFHGLLLFVERTFATMIPTELYEYKDSQAVMRLYFTTLGRVMQDSLLIFLE